MADRLIPLAAMEKLLKQAGADRVADDAKAALKELLEQRAAELAGRAMLFARHAGRKTVKAEDVRLAIKAKAF